MSLQISQLVVRAGEFTLGGVSMDIETGECAALMGKSGSGKTTLMEALCGLRKVTGGSILLGGKDITNLRPGERGIGLVPQDTVLFPHMSVAEHLAFGPELHGWKKAEIGERVEELAEALSIADLLDRKPRGLSGGEAKRVSLGRAIAARPKLLCLDEALTGLDAETHAAIQELLQNIIAQEKQTTLHITHHRQEAEALGDRIYSMKRGQLEAESAEFVK